MVVSTFQRTKGWQRLTDFTSRLKALQWFPMLLICLIEGMVYVDAGRHKLFADLAGFGTFFVALGMPFPSVMAVAVARREFGGGRCLILGLGTRVGRLRRGRHHGQCHLDGAAHRREIVQ
jgi:hypothetical protein